MRWALVFATAGFFCVSWKATGGGIGGRSIITFLPVLVVLPAFFLGNAGGFRAIFSELAEVKRQGKRTLLLIWISFAALAAMTLITAPTTKSVSGIYEGTFQGVSEVLELRQDGTFLQKVSLPSGELTNRGSWDLKGRALSLSGYLVFFDAVNNRAVIPPTSYSDITFEYSPGALIHDWGSGYYVAERR